MALEDYVKEQAQVGQWESVGEFRLDLAQAVEKLASYTLPSQAHYVLKIVQVANSLGAESVRITQERFRTVVRFRAPSGQSAVDAQAIFRAFADPLTIGDPILADLVSALLGTIHSDTLETLWSYSEGYRVQRVFINPKRQFSIEESQLSRPVDPQEHPCAFSLSVLHPRTWKFWKAASRRASVISLLRDHCQFSASKIVVDNLESPAGSAYNLNNHRRTRVFDQNQGMFQFVYCPFDTIAFKMSSGEKPDLSIARPSLSAFLVRENHFNLWASGLRVNNTLRPDGMSSGAWMLQFIEKGENVSMRMAPKRVRCRAVLGLNRDSAANDEHLRLRVVRNGVTVLEQEMTEWDAELKDFRGASLLIADNELETDLTGFQVIQNQQFLELIQSYRGFLQEALEYYQEGKKMLSL